MADNDNIFSSDELQEFRRKKFPGEIFKEQEGTPEESKGYINVTDLNNELFTRYIRRGVADEYKLEYALEEKRDLKKINYANAGKKRSIKWKIKKATTKAEKKKLQFMYEQLPKSMPHKIVNSKIKKYSGKDFDITVDDRFHGKFGYKVKAHTLLKKRNPAFYLLNQMSKKVKSHIPKEEDEHRKEILQKVFNKIEYNKKIVNTSYATSEYKKVGDYEVLMLIEFFGDDMIDLNL